MGISRSMSRSRIAGIVLGSLGAISAVVGAVLAFTRPPQMGPAEDVFKTVDALYTAVRNQDARRLGECEKRLHGYRDAGKLPIGAASHLDGVIARARDGKWESAAEKLYTFMMAQKREGAEEPRPAAKKPKTRLASR